MPIPESQAQEDYPADMRGTVTLAKDAPTGPRRVRVFTAQGGAGGPVFVVGDLPEVIEKEIDGDAIPEPISAAGHRERSHLPARRHRPLGVRRARPARP